MPAQASVATTDGRVEFDHQVLELVEGADWQAGLPHPDFVRARQWADRFDDARYDDAWLTVQRVWLAWLAPHLGADYRLHESADALLLSAADARATRLALDYLSLTGRRVARSLAGLAGDRLAEKPVVLMLRDADDYYRYFSGMYPEEGEFAMSAGVHFNGPAPHFVVNGCELGEVEATVVHEMTHAFVSHLPIPAWLNEGLAVNMEFAFGRVADSHALIELAARHRRFWTPALIQDYWSGASFQRPDEGQELSYDLARLMVAGMSEDWTRFERFARSADLADAGKAAAEAALDLDLGEYVRHVMEAEGGEWAPRPQAWNSAPERGAFCWPRIPSI